MQLEILKKQFFRLCVAIYNYIIVLLIILLFKQTKYVTIMLFNINVQVVT